MLRNLVFVTLVAGCGSGPAVAFSELDVALQQARCQRLARCGLFSDEATCNTYFAIRAQPSLVAAVEAGEVRYDGEEAQRCADELAALSCDLSVVDLRAVTPACERMLRGDRQGGETCYFREACASLQCTIAPDCEVRGCCPGSCRAVREPGTVGDSCEVTDDCRAGTFCGPDAVCMELGEDGALCARDNECGDGFLCMNPLPTQLGNCRPAPKLGERCPYLRCADEGLRCDEATKLCVPVGLPGDACTTFRDCSPYMQCDEATKLCREYPALGEVCDNACAGTAWCERLANSPTGVCAEPQEIGAPCGANNACASFHCQEGVIFDACQDPPVCF